MIMFDRVSELVDILSESSKWESNNFRLIVMVLFYLVEFLLVLVLEEVLGVDSLLLIMIEILSLLWIVIIDCGVWSLVSIIVIVIIVIVVIIIVQFVIIHIVQFVIVIIVHIDIKMIIGKQSVYTISSVIEELIRSGLIK